MWLAPYPKSRHQGLHDAYTRSGLILARSSQFCLHGLSVHQQCPDAGVQEGKETLDIPPSMLIMAGVGWFMVFAPPETSVVYNVY